MQSRKSSCNYISFSILENKVKTWRRVDIEKISSAPQEVVDDLNNNIDLLEEYTGKAGVGYDSTLQIMEATLDVSFNWILMTLGREKEFFNSPFAEPFERYKKIIDPPYTNLIGVDSIVNSDPILAQLQPYRRSV